MRIKKRRSSASQGSKRQKRDNSRGQDRPHSDSSIQTRKKGRVSFASANEINPIPTLEEYSDAELASMWFSVDELERILKVIDRTLRKMDRGKEVKDDRYCTRGLESLTLEGETTRLQRQSDSYEAVFEKQYFQEVYGDTDPEMIARVYAKKAFDSRVQARLNAITDASEVLY